MAISNATGAQSFSLPLVDSDTESKVQTFSGAGAHDITDAGAVGNAVAAGFFFVRVSNTGANNLRVTPNADGTAGDLVAPGGTWEHAFHPGVLIYTIGTNGQPYNVTAFHPSTGQLGGG